MVCGPSTYDVISSRHVTISGLPKTITDERFGPVQRLFRPAENQKLLCVTFIDPEAAALACDSNHYDENTPYEIKLSNRESMPDSDPDQSYSSEESSAHFYDPQLDDDETEGDSDCDIPVSDFINPSESNGESSQSRNSRDYWAEPRLLSNSVGSVVYEVGTEPPPSETLPNVIKIRSKLPGTPSHIGSCDSEPLIKIGHSTKRLESILESDQNQIDDRKSRVQVQDPPQRDPWEEPSTSKDTARKEEQYATCSIHVSNLERHREEHFRRRFESYGRIIDIEILKSGDHEEVAVIQFTNIDDAHRAMSDANHPKPMSYSSRPDRRLILFYLPLDTNEAVMLTIRGLTNKIEDITVDWIARNAVITFESNGHAIHLFKEMRVPDKNNFGEHKVAIDYCSERLHRFFLQKREENLIEARSSVTPCESEPHPISHLSAPSTSSCSDQVVEEVRMIISPTRPVLVDEDDDIQILSSHENSSSPETAMHCSDFGSDDEDRISDIRDEEYDEYEYVNNTTQDSSHEQDRSQSPSNESHDEFNGTRRFLNEPCDETDDNRIQHTDYIDLTTEPSTSRWVSSENFNGCRRKSSLRAYNLTTKTYSSNSPSEEYGSVDNYDRFTSKNTQSVSTYTGSSEDDNVTPIDDQVPSSHENGVQADDNGSGTDGNSSRSNDNRSQSNDNQSQQSDNSRSSANNSRSPRSGIGSHGYRRDGDDDDDDDEDKKPEIKFECDPSTSDKKLPPVKKIEVDDEFPNTVMSTLIRRLLWKEPVRMVQLKGQIERVMTRNQKTRTIYEKWTGRPFPKFIEDGDSKPRRVESSDSRDHYNDTSFQELDLRIRDFRKVSEYVEMEELRSLDPKELQKDIPLLLNKISARPSLDESRISRFSFDSHHPAELAQRSHSLCVGPMTPAAPYQTTTPLLVNTSHHGTSQPSASGVTTPRSAQPPVLMSPLSRHNSVSSVGRPASIQTHRHHSHALPIDTTIPPPMISANNEVVIPQRDSSSSRRSSETLAPLRSPPFVNQNTNTGAMPPSASQMIAATGTHSVSSSAHSTPRHSISGTPVNYEPSTSKSSQLQTSKTNKPEKVQVRHDSISKPGPSNAANALQGRSQSMTAGDYKKSNPSTPAYRDAGSDLVAQIMSNQPSMGFKKLPRIEKKPSALQNVNNQQNNIGSAPSTPLSVHQAMLLKDKEKEKEKRKKERQLEREREARKEMKRKETKEERNKRKEMERAKRDEDERRERKREKQRMKEKEERRREKERERKKSEKEKHKKKKQHRRDDDSDESDSSSNDELDLDAKKSTKEMTQEEKDHQLALILSKGSIIENLKSRRRSDKRHDPMDKSQNKNQNPGTRRVLIESSDDNGEDENDDEKGKSDSSSGEASDTDKRTKQAPPINPIVATAPSKELKQKVQKEREKGELSSSSEDEENRQEKDFELQQKLKLEREKRKRQKSLTTYSSDEHGDRKNAPKRVRKDGSDDAISTNTWGTKDDRNQRKRKLVHRLSSEDESRRKAKQRDFRDIPHEDVSDEEEVEVTSRVRRQSSSSTASNKESHGKREKSGKTPLRIATPARAPLQSPKLLSPKILSPKTSNSSTKRPSISDQESLISPRVRNRTTSSTSTATTSSKHETASIPDKPLSPPVTAKSSVSSIDDFVIRDDFSSNSAVCSPMSSTGRPMVLTKAAMKAFNSSPPKKKSSSSGPQDSSSDSSSSSSTSGDSSSSSSDDSSDEENMKASMIVVDETAKPNEELYIDAQNDHAIATEVPVNEPLKIVADPEKVTETKEQPAFQADKPYTSPPTTVSQSLDVVPEVPPPDDIKVEDEEIINEKEITFESKENSDLQPEHEQNQEITLKHIEPESYVVNPTTEQKKEAEQKLEIESVVTPVVDEHPSPKSIDEVLVAQEETSSTHNLISDQETDQAVQSIFDEEEADDFPQYPDLVMPKDEKEAPEKKLTSQESVETGEPNSNLTDHPLTNGHSSNSLLSPPESTSAAKSNSENSEEPEVVAELDEVKTEKDDVPDEKSDQVVVSAPASPTEMKVDVEEQDENNELKIVESPEQTPTPELIPNDKTQDILREASPILSAEEENTKQDEIERTQSPVQPKEPLKVSVSVPDQEVLRPSPLPATVPVSQLMTVEPVAVLHQPHLEKPSPIPMTNVQKELQLIDEYIARGNSTELAQMIEKNVHLRTYLTPDRSQRIQDLLNHSSMNMQNIGNYQTPFVNQNHQQLWLIAQQEQREKQESQRRFEEEKKQKEELERRKKIDRLEKKRQSENQMNLSTASKQLSATEQLLKYMPLEARQFYHSSNPFGLPAFQSPETNGVVNGNHPSIQQFQRPSSATSTSSTSARIPLQPSTSINQRNLDPESVGARVQRWFYSVSLLLHSVLIFSRSRTLNIYFNFF
ncbi:unnamed protein product [Caenorhabditis brenneri]